MKLERLGEFRVLTLRETGPDAPLCDTAAGAADYWRDKVKNDPRFSGDVETLVGLVLSVRRRVIGHYMVATGTVDTMLCHPREVFRPAIVANAAGIIVIHNHPSGDWTPSEADILVTRNLIRAGQLLKIELLDHLIMGSIADGRISDYCSLRELGYFNI